MLGRSVDGFRAGLSLVFFVWLGTMNLAPLAAWQDSGRSGLGRYSEFSQGSIVGPILEEDSESVKIKNIVSGLEVVCPKDRKYGLERDISWEDAIRYASVTSVMAWRVAKLAENSRPVGKVAKVEQNSVFVTLGQPNGIQKGQILLVYRDGGKVLDPDTGEELGAIRDKIAKLEVVEAKDLFSRAKFLGDLEVRLEIGDEVQPETQGIRVAVCPLIDENGQLTNVSMKLSEEMTSALVQNKVSVVERSALAPVLGELLAQNTSLFDAGSAQKIGQLTGASVVVTGKIVSDRNRGTAFLRLVDVRKGEVLLSISDTVNLVNAKVITKEVGLFQLPILPEVSDKEAASGGMMTQTFRMSDRRKWEDSNILVKAGQTVSITAPNNGIDPKNYYNVHGVNAPIGSLLARIDNHVMDIGTKKEFVAPCDGRIWFRSNLKKSPNHTMLITVQVKD